MPYDPYGQQQPFDPYRLPQPDVFGSMRPPALGRAGPNLSPEELRAAIDSGQFQSGATGPWPDLPPVGKAIPDKPVTPPVPQPPPQAAGHFLDIQNGPSVVRTTYSAPGNDPGALRATQLQDMTGGGPPVDMPYNRDPGQGGQGAHDLAFQQMVNSSLVKAGYAGLSPLLAGAGGAPGGPTGAPPGAPAMGSFMGVPAPIVSAGGQAGGQPGGSPSLIQQAILLGPSLGLNPKNPSHMSILANLASQASAATQADKELGAKIDFQKGTLANEAERNRILNTQVNEKNDPEYRRRDIMDKITAAHPDWTPEQVTAAVADKVALEGALIRPGAAAAAPGAAATTAQPAPGATAPAAPAAQQPGQTRAGQAVARRQTIGPEIYDLLNAPKKPELGDLASRLVQLDRQRSAAGQPGAVQGMKGDLTAELSRLYTPDEMKSYLYPLSSIPASVGLGGLGYGAGKGVGMAAGGMAPASSAAAGGAKALGGTALGGVGKLLPWLGLGMAAPSIGGGIRNAYGSAVGNDTEKARSAMRELLGYQQEPGFWRQFFPAGLTP